MKSHYIELTAKQTHYAIDGTGRDSYINFDNGGNFRGYLQQGKGKFQVGTFPSQRQFRQKSVSIQGKPLHYIGDGTGRDCYIISDEGGIAKSGNKFNYLKYLRSPSELSSKRQEHIPVSVNTQSSWRKRMTSQSFYQRNLDRRLSTPREYDDPYKQMRSTFATSMRSSSRVK